MKKMLFVAGGFAMLLVMLVGMCLTGFSGGEAGSVSSPLAVFADEDEAYAYQYIGSELGIPWDLTLLSDGIHAYAAGESELKNHNPLLTSLQFCILLEEEFIAVPVDPSEVDESTEKKPHKNPGKPKEEDTPEEGSEEEPEEEQEMEWVSNKIIYYTGTEEILAYLGIDAQNADLTYTDAASIVTALTERAEEKSNDDVMYEVMLLANNDYEDVLRSLIGLSEKNIDYVLELYDSGYLVSLYDYTFEFPDVVLPDIVQGNVSRADLASVAVSLINHPYLMGGKSNTVGPPSGPLDCSGYVDWVYMQCFGVTVASGGSVPEGVAVSGTAMQWYASEPIKSIQLKVGDLGFVRDPATIKNGQVNHVGIYLGKVDGKDYWIHCGGSSYGTESSPKGRVGISLSSGLNSDNPVTGDTFSPAMKACKFKYFRRPRFTFTDD